jgi:hypothetical protein
MCAMVRIAARISISDKCCSAKAGCMGWRASQPTSGKCCNSGNDHGRVVSVNGELLLLYSSKAMSMQGLQHWGRSTPVADWQLTIALRASSCGFLPAPGGAAGNHGRGLSGHRWQSAVCRRPYEWHLCHRPQGAAGSRSAAPLAEPWGEQPHLVLELQATGVPEAQGCPVTPGTQRSASYPVTSVLRVAGHPVSAVPARSAVCGKWHWQGAPGGLAYLPFEAT